MSKRDRIQEILAQRFAIGSVHLKKTHHELEHEILIFGPRMGHDDTIDALAYACKYANPPKSMKKTKKGDWYKHTPTAKSWVIAAPKGSKHWKKSEFVVANNKYKEGK
jgi:hypothetical protein